MKRYVQDVYLGEIYPGDELSEGEPYFVPRYEVRGLSQDSIGELKRIDESSDSSASLDRVRIKTQSDLNECFVYGQLKRVPFVKASSARWYEWELSHFLPVLQSLQFDKDGLSKLREDLSQEGHYSREPIIGTVAVRLNEREHIIIGKLEESPEKPGYWLFPSDSDRRFRIFTCKSAERTVSVGAQTITILSLAAEIGETARIVDWRPQQEVLADLLAWMQSSASISEMGVLANIAAVEAVLDAPQSKNLEQPLRDRFDELIQSVKLIGSEWNDLFSLISSRPEFNAHVSEAVEAAIEEAKIARISEIEREVNARAASLESERIEREHQVELLRGERERLSVDIDGLLGRFSDLKTQIETHSNLIQRDLDKSSQISANLERTIRERAEHVVKDIVQDAAESAVLRFSNELDILKTLGVVGTTSQSLHPSEPVLRNRKFAAVSFPYSAPVTKPLPKATPAQLLKVVQEAAKDSGIQSSGPERILGALLADCVPIVQGSAGIQALQVVADVLMNGALSVVPISPTDLEPSELLGRFDSFRDSFSPDARGLADLIVSAQTVDHPILVVFDGINRAPFESALLPLLNLQADQSSRQLNVVHRGIIEQSDPFWSMTEFCWPSNLLVAATTLQGAATLPLGSTWSPSCCLLNNVVDVTRPMDMLPLTRGWIRTNDWIQARERAQETEVNGEADLHGVDSEFVPDDIFSASGRFAATLLALGISGALWRAFLDGFVPWMCARGLSDIIRTSTFQDRGLLERTIVHASKLTFGRES